MEHPNTAVCGNRGRRLLTLRPTGTTALCAYPVMLPSLSSHSWKFIRFLARPLVPIRCITLVTASELSFVMYCERASESPSE